MLLGMIILIIFLGLIGLAIAMVLKQIKKTDPKNFDSSTKEDISTAQEFLPFEDIRDGLICLGNQKYRLVIDCSSINYHLKTDKEKQMIDASYNRFVNSLTFPISIFNQTKVIDMNKMIRSLEEEMKETVKEFPQLEEYANIFYNEMINLDSYIGNNKQKKKYIIVPFDDALYLENLSNEEKFEYALNEIRHRANIIIDGLSSIGIRGTVLSTKETAELIYSVYHRTNYEYVENIVSGEALSLLVEGEVTAYNQLSDDEKLDLMLFQTQKQIETELLRDGIPLFLKNNYETTIRKLDELRDEVAGYYKQKIDPEFNENENYLDFKEADFKVVNDRKLMTNQGIGGDIFDEVI